MAKVMMKKCVMGEGAGQKVVEMVASATTITPSQPWKPHKGALKSLPSQEQVLIQEDIFMQAKGAQAADSALLPSPAGFSAKLFGAAEALHAGKHRIGPQVRISQAGLLGDVSRKALWHV